MEHGYVLAEYEPMASAGGSVNSDFDGFLKMLCFDVLEMLNVFRKTHISITLNPQTAKSKMTARTTGRYHVFIKN